MTEIIGVRFKSGGKIYYFDPRGLHVEAGQNIIIETSRGIEFGECTLGNSQVEDSEVVQPLRPLIRIATEEDCRTVENNRKKEARALEICQQKILDHKLDMKLVDAEYNFEGNKVLFFFTSDGRVDFRDLVKDLASVFRMRIELRQIGVRDEAKMMGGLGICGQPFCCASFLDEFQPVSIKMAKTQNLSLNPTKISGTCGRLMCCLKYEQDAYEDLLKRLPKVDALVETPEGSGTITAVNLLREQVKVRLDGAPETPKSFSNNDIRVLRPGGGKPRRDPPSSAAAGNNGGNNPAGGKRPDSQPSRDSRPVSRPAQPAEGRPQPHNDARPQQPQNVENPPAQQSGKPGGNGGPEFRRQRDRHRPPRRRNGERTDNRSDSGNEKDSAPASDKQ